MRLKSLNLTIAVFLAGSGVLATCVAAQTPQEPSIADAARLNREQKKSAPKTAPVITNDTFAPSAPTNQSAPPPQPAQQSGDSSSQATSSPDSKSSTPSAKPELSQADADKLKGELAVIKQELKDKQAEVDLIQRLLNLDRDAFYSKPDSSRDSAGKAKIDAEQDELKQKSEEFEKLKAKLQSIAPELLTQDKPQ